MPGNQVRSADVLKGSEQLVQEDEDVEPYLGYLPRQPLLHLGTQVLFISWAQVGLCDVGACAWRLLQGRFQLVPYFN